MTNRMSPTCTTDDQRSHISKVVCALEYGRTMKQNDDVGAVNSYDL